MVWNGEVILCFLMAAIFSTDQKKVVNRTVRDYTAIMSIDVYQSPQYSEYFLGVEPFSPSTSSMKRTHATFYVTGFQKHALQAISGAFSIFDLIKCVQFTYVYAVMILSGPAEAYDVRGFLGGVV